MFNSFFLILLFVGSYYCHGQVFIEDIIESKGLDDLEASFLIDRYNYYINKPLNLNGQITLLQEFPFWSDLQRQAVLEYREKLGNIVSIEELSLLQIFSFSELQFLKPILSTKNESALGFLESSMKGEFIKRVSTSNKRNIYEGSTYGIQKRLKLSSPKIKLSVVIDKDRGEKNWSRYFGPDFSGGVISYRHNDTRFIFGDYKLNIGQGLLLWQSFGLDKNFSVLSASRNAVSLQEKLGADEFRFYRGVAIVKRWRSFKFTSFYSKRKLDASLRQGGITTIRKTGLHRTESEISGKGNVDLYTYGSQFEFHSKNLTLGSLFMTDYYSVPFSSVSFSTRDLLHRQDLSYLNLTWDYTGRFWNQYAEVLSDFKSNFSLTIGNNFLVDSRTVIDVAFRSLSSRLRPLFADPFSEKSNVGEKGIYLGINSRISSSYQIVFYRDQYLFEEGVYQKPFVIHGVDYGLQLSKYVNSLGEFYIRIKHEVQQSSNAEIYYRALNRLRFHYKNESEKIACQTRLEYSFSRSLGWLYYLQVQSKNRFSSVTFRTSFFSIPDYEQAIYAYLPNVRYAFSSHGYYLQGMHHVLKWRLNSFKLFKPSFVIGYFSYLDAKSVDFYNASFQIEMKL